MQTHSRVRSAGAFSVSGPSTDKRYPTADVALSAAITIASKAADEATFYVRDPHNECKGRVERDRHGHVRIFKAAV